jgi:hypothetical protein
MHPHLNQAYTDTACDIKKMIEAFVFFVYRSTRTNNLQTCECLKQRRSASYP